MPEPTDRLLGTLVAGRYRLEARIGAGALSVVYRARHVLIGREFAIKVLPLGLPGRDGFRAWFLREARAANLVNHPNVVEIYDSGETDEGLVYLVMELLVGERLSDRIAGGPLAARESFSIVEQVASALSRAHQLGVVHRDLKPEHVFLVERGGRSGIVKLIDFGLARVDREGRLGPAGAILGTPEYFAPEQARGEEAGPEADLYSLGIVLFEMLTGRLPFESDNPSRLAECHRSVPAPDPRLFRADLDPDAAAVTLRLLEKDPRRRYGDAHHVRDECRAVLSRLGPAESDIAGVASSARAAPRAPLAEALRWAVAASLFGRMAAVAYPGAGVPAPVRGGVATAWSLVAELARIDGELDVLEAWGENLRQRVRETAERLGREIEELSAQASRLAREEAAESREEERLEEARSAAVLELDAARLEAEERDRRCDGPGSLVALESAAAAAALLQRCLEALQRLDSGRRRREVTLRNVGTRRSQLRDQLDRETSRLESDRAAGRPQLLALAREREEVVGSLAAAARTLREHFARRPECRSLLTQLDGIQSCAEEVELAPLPIE